MPQRCRQAGELRVSAVNARPSFFAELKRRHVYKVGAMYCVAGWLLVQIVTQVLPVFDVSALGQRILVLLVLAGFPVALVLAWLFDITPQGIVRTADAPAGDEAPAAARQRQGMDRKLNYLLGALLLAALGYEAYQRLASHDAGADGSDKSIAVLPFENLSDDKTNAYFAVGMQDEILTRLAKVGSLKVISRTSTAHYASSPDNLPEIARQLGVANILEGSVQKIGDAVHVNVQLIRAATDEHLWAESYNRKLDDVFGVEGEVAQTVAEALKAQLSGAEHKAMMMRPTDNQAAYAAYARGRSIETGTYDLPHTEQAAQAYVEAARLDPRFALAWAHAAIAGSFLYFNGSHSAQAAPEAILHAADTALSLQPELGEAWLAQGYYRYRVLRDYAGGEQAFETARQHLPNDPQVLLALEQVQRRLGKWDEAVANLQRALQLDPRNVSDLVAGSLELMDYLGRFDEARRMLDQAQALTPDSPNVAASRMQIEQDAGRIDEAAAWAARLPPPSREADWDDNELVNLRFYQHRYDEVIALAQAKLPPPGQPLPLDQSLELATDLARAQELSGHRAEAAATYERVVHSIKPAPDTTVRQDETRALDWLAQAYAGLGDKTAALNTARQAVEAYRNDAVARPALEATQAGVQARFGDTEAALTALQHLVRVPAGVFAGELMFDPRWDPLRGDPRFQKLIADTLAAGPRSTAP